MGTPRAGRQLYAYWIKYYSVEDCVVSLSLSKTNWVNILYFLELAPICHWYIMLLCTDTLLGSSSREQTFFKGPAADATEAP
jgi:hypothetical protein